MSNNKYGIDQAYTMVVGGHMHKQFAGFIFLVRPHSPCLACSKVPPPSEIEHKAGGGIGKLL